MRSSARHRINLTQHRPKGGQVESKDLVTCCKALALEVKQIMRVYWHTLVKIQALKKLNDLFEKAAQMYAPDPGNQACLAEQLMACSSVQSPSTLPCLEACKDAVWEMVAAKPGEGRQGWHICNRTNLVLG